MGMGTMRMRGSSESGSVYSSVSCGKHTDIKRRSEDDAPADAMEEDDVPVVEEEDDMSKYKLEDYDEDAGATGTFSNIKGLQFYQNNDEDPYITLKEVRISYSLPENRV
jgi:hypothetical protein